MRVNKENEGLRAQMTNPCHVYIYLCVLGIGKWILYKCCVNGFMIRTRVTSRVRFNTKGAEEAEIKDQCNANDVWPYIFIQAFKE